MPPKPCIVEGCDRPKMSPRHKCGWHWIATQPIAVQVAAAEARLAVTTKNGAVRRVRIAPEHWPPGHRWCAGCQSWVPLDYVSGSRCKACSSRDKHASKLSITYQLDPADYAALLDWQQGRCFVCGQLPGKRRLAVDHDHDTGDVRGLLCASDEWGCNVRLSHLLNDLDIAQRALMYAEQPPLERMREGQTAPRLGPPPRSHSQELRYSLLGRPARPGDEPAPF